MLSKYLVDGTVQVGYLEFTPAGWTSLYNSFRIQNSFGGKSYILPADIFTVFDLSFMLL